MAGCRPRRHRDLWRAAWRLEERAGSASQRLCTAYRRSPGRILSSKCYGVLPGETVSARRGCGVPHDRRWPSDAIERSRYRYTVATPDTAEIGSRSTDRSRCISCHNSRTVWRRAGIRLEDTAEHGVWRTDQMALGRAWDDFRTGCVE